jgi:hypothetical protein
MLKSFSGPQTIDQKISSLLKPLFHSGKKEFILINNLVKNWPEIIGKKYAQFCYPKSVTLGKEGGKLTVAVYNSAVGFFLESSSELIIERIAGFYGFKSIVRIIIKQEPKIINISNVSEIKLSEVQENFLQEKVAAITDLDLAQTLQKIGREIFQK